MSDVKPVDFTVNSFNKMMQAKVIRRGDTGMQIQLKNVFDKLREDGSCWNRRDMNSPKTLENIEKLVKHLTNGGQVPAIEVQPRDGGGVVKIDGYCRVEAFKVVDASGIGELWIPIVPFKGDERQALVRIETSNRDSKLTALEQLDLYQSMRAELRAAGEKGTLQQIADEFGVSRQYVDNILKLGDLDAEGRALVESGKVSAKDASKELRKSVEGATAALKKASAPKPLLPNKALMDDMYIGLTDLFEAIPKQAKLAAAEFLKGERPAGDAVMIPVGELAKLMALKAEGERQIEVAAERRHKKEEAARQESMANDDLKPEPEPEKTVDSGSDAGQDKPSGDNPYFGKDAVFEFAEPAEGDDPDMSFL